MTLYNGTEWARWHKRVDHKLQEHKKRARKHGLPVHFCPTDFRAALRYFNFCCAYCGQPETAFEYGLTVDHFLPLGNSGAGGTTVYNILPACPTCNNDKAHRNPYDWLLERFGEARALEIADQIEMYFDSASSLSRKPHASRSVDDTVK